MIRPEELQSELPHGPWSCRGTDIWDVMCAAVTGDVPALQRLLARDSNLYRAEYWYTQPIHFAVREGHLEVVRVLLAAGADATRTNIVGEDLVLVARDRGHEAVAELLEQTRASSGRVHPCVEDHAIHAAASADDLESVRALLDSDLALIERGDKKGGTPLHRAVLGSATNVIRLLLDRGANIHAVHGAGPGDASGYAPAEFEPIDLALFWHRRGDLDTARLLLDRGATCDLPIVAALGDLDAVRAMLDGDPGRILDKRPFGNGALSAAVEFGHQAIVRVLLERGTDPNWPEGAYAPRGTALHAAARAGDRAMVELLLSHGADPNGTIDSSGSATYAAKTRELRTLLMAHGG
ncbi:MAG TPA: ankyrin repeat domain-containing protein, partial [Polyangiaceae bacterium]